VVRILALIGIAALIGGFALALGASATLPAVALILLGLLIEAVTGAISIARRLRDSMMEWKDLLSSGPGAVRLVSFEPPKGMIFNRDAVLTFEIEGTEGQTKSLQREITIPIPQAIMWKATGHVPLPLARALNERADMNLHLWRRGV
jgi:hypothetical protein